jgi:hypothetical protein
MSPLPFVKVPLRVGWRRPVFEEANKTGKVKARL